MARNFVQSASEHINDFPLVSSGELGTVYTIAARCKPSLLDDTFQTVFAQGNTTVINNTAFQLSISSSVVGEIDKWRFLHIDDSVAVADLFSTADAEVNVWQSVVGTRNVNDYELFVKAISVDTVTVTLGTFTTDEFVIGGRVNNSTTRQSFFNGDIADVAIWTVVLTQAEIDAYNAGVSPALIRPDKLIRYMPLWGTTEEPELTGTGGKGTLVNTPAVSTTNPPASLYKNRKVFAFPASLKVSGFVFNNAGPVARTVRAYSRITKELLGETVSNGGDGSYEILSVNASLAYVIAISEGARDPIKILDKVIPLT